MIEYYTIGMIGGVPEGGQNKQNNNDDDTN